jgi:hypothetical protein
MHYFQAINIFDKKKELIFLTLILFTYKKKCNYIKLVLLYYHYYK